MSERNTCRKGATESATINKKKRAGKHTGSAAQTRENGYPEKGEEKMVQKRRLWVPIRKPLAQESIWSLFVSVVLLGMEH